MKIFRIISYFCLIAHVLGTSAHTAAQNTVSRSAEYIAEAPDTFTVNFEGMSNVTKRKTLNIMFSIKAKSTAFDIYSVMLSVHDSVVGPLKPFSMNVGASETGDSLVTWECVVRFPYRDSFYNDDMCILDTSQGKFSMHLVPESIRNREIPFWRRYFYQLLAAGIFLIVATGSYILITYLRRRRKDIEEKLLIEQAFESKERINAELRKSVELLYTDRWDVFNRLCNEYFNKKDAQSEDVRLSVYKELERQIDDMRSSKSLAELEKLVDTYNDGIMQQIRTQIPELTRKDITFLIYLYSGFSPRAICLFTDIKIKNFYNRRARLRDKILASGSADCEKFASKM